MSNQKDKNKPADGYEIEPRPGQKPIPSPDPGQPSDPKTGKGGYEFIE